MRGLHLVAVVSFIGVALSCDPGWRYHMRSPMGEPLAEGPEHFATASLSGGRVEYAIRAEWFATSAHVQSIIRNRGAVPLRVRVDRARFVTASGLAIAPRTPGESRAPRPVEITSSGPAAVGDGEAPGRDPVPAPTIEVAPGSEVRIRRKFGPMNPYRGCVPDPDLGSVLFVDDGLELGDEPVEASFTLRR